jgi:hypothetical protein
LKKKIKELDFLPNYSVVLLSGEIMLMLNGMKEEQNIM